MNRFLAFVLGALLTIAQAATAVTDLTYGSLISGRAEATDIVCTAANVGLTCNTCNSYLVCSGATELGNGTCESPNPYCDTVTNACTAERPTSCAADPTNFKCPAEGFFPDPDNCQTYYFCDSAKVAQLWECPINYVYNAVNKACMRKFWPWDCVVMKCLTGNSFIVNRANANLYAFCDDKLVATLFQCPLNQEFASGCKYVCKREGYSAGKAANEAFVCTRSGFDWVQTIYFCPTGYEYNEKFVCVKVASTSSQ